ncbi:hypothetical protein QMK33_11730 [Hymenobacter sp. H14-R3]|uniref:hypothetical protein n=1 Tax=Hymenobacter sp. H14-R3 TaxID=3046308 RepID=UPI0024BA5579|nr:hypothetical protein [Hymenobacter sp. H14-R3]MDJ0365823.1 hypothetical protein [Hymenobacter sp. H14-R3]
MSFSTSEMPAVLPARPPRQGWRRGSLLVLAGGLLQLVLLLVTYGKLLLHPGQYLLVSHYDGIKSYYSLATFLRQPLREGMLQHGHNYPFGEYIYYTDISPLVSVPLHVLVQLVPALAPYGVYLYDVVTLGGLVVSTLLLVSILRRLALPAWLALVLALVLPWLSPQAFRLNVGHMSLSYTPAVLLPLWLLQGLYGAWRAGRPTGRWWVGLGLATTAATWLHFYYLGIVGGWLGAFFLVWIGREALAHRPWRRLAGRAAALLSLVAVFTFGLLQVLDKRHGERPTGSGGYDWIEWKFQFGTLFHGHDFYKIRFFLERTAPVPYESTAYLGAFVLYGLVVVGILALVARHQRRQGLAEPGLLPTLPSAATDGNRAFLGMLLLAAVPLALAALGESLDVDNGNYSLHNYLNPFLWVHKVTDRITQFRALGRFIWPFWWSVVLGFAWYAGQAWRLAQARQLRWLQGLWVVLAGLGVVDMLNAQHHYTTVTQVSNLLAAPATDEVRQLVGWLKPGYYQALLPFPFYHSGSEPKEGELYYNVDPDDPHCNRTYQLGMVTGLPLMSHKATRTPYYQARELMTMFQAGGPGPDLLGRLDKRPILVYLDTTYYNGGNNYYRDLLKDRPEMLGLFNRAPDFIREQHMRRLTHQGPYSLYEWQPGK